MIWGLEPSIICGLLHKAGDEKKFEKMVNQKYGMTLRKISFYDIGIQLDDKNYNNSVNFLKHFVSPILSRGFALLPFQKYIKKRLGKRGVALINQKEIQKIITDTSHPLSRCGFSPLLVDTKYMNFKLNGKFVYSDAEKENLKRLINFESKGYKPIINGKPTDLNLLIEGKDLK